MKIILATDSATDSDYISFQRNCFDLPSNQSLLINSAPDRSKVIKKLFHAKKNHAENVHREAHTSAQKLTENLLLALFSV